MKSAVKNFINNQSKNKNTFGFHNTDERYLRSNDFVSKCSTYDSASLCSACESGSKLLSIKSNTINNICTSCGETCKCGAKCSTCQP